MCAVRTPSRRSTSALSRVPSMGSSFASCFGASTPVSPRRLGGHGLLGGQACGSYRRLELDELEEEEHTRTHEKPAQEEEEEDADERYDLAEQRTEGPFLHNVIQQFSLEEVGMHDVLAVQEHHAREGDTENVQRVVEQWSKGGKPEMHTHHASEAPADIEDPYASVVETEDRGRERKGARELEKHWNLREENTLRVADTPEKQEACQHGRGEDKGEAGGYPRERKGLQKLAKLWIMREKTRKEVLSASSEDEVDDHFGRERTGDLQRRRPSEEEEGVTPRRESLCRKVKLACTQAWESARRSSPHVSELFLGNQFLMQVTASSFVGRRRVARNLPPSAGFLVAGDPLVSRVSPPRSSASSTL